MSSSCWATSPTVSSYNKTMFTNKTMSWSKFGTMLLISQKLLKIKNHVKKYFFRWIPADLRHCHLATDRTTSGAFFQRSRRTAQAWHARRTWRWRSRSCARSPRCTWRPPRRRSRPTPPPPLAAASPSGRSRARRRGEGRRRGRGRLPGTRRR